MLSDRNSESTSGDSTTLDPKKSTDGVTTDSGDFKQPDRERVSLGTTLLVCYTRIKTFPKK